MSLFSTFDACYVATACLQSTNVLRLLIADPQSHYETANRFLPPARKRSCEATPPFSHAILLFFVTTTDCPPIPIKAIVRSILPHAAHDRLTHSTESLNNPADWLRFYSWLRIPMPWPDYDLYFLVFEGYFHLNVNCGLPTILVYS